MQSAAPNGRSHERSGPGQARRGLRLGERAAFSQVAALRGKAFPNLGSSAFAGLAVRAALQLPSRCCVASTQETALLSASTRARPGA